MNRVPNLEERNSGACLLLFVDCIKPCDELWNHHQAKRKTVISKAHRHLLHSSRFSSQARASSVSASILKSAKMITALVKPYKLDARQHSGYRRSVSLLLENFSLGLVELLATLANSANNILNLLLSIYMLIE